MEDSFESINLDEYVVDGNDCLIEYTIESGLFFYNPHPLFSYLSTPNSERKKSPNVTVYEGFIKNTF